MTTLLESLQALAEKWRKRVDYLDSAEKQPNGDETDQCADDLSALIAQHQSPEQAARGIRFARFCKVCGALQEP